MTGNRNSWPACPTCGQVNTSGGRTCDACARAERRAAAERWLPTAVDSRAVAAREARLSRTYGGQLHRTLADMAADADDTAGANLEIGPVRPVQPRASTQSGDCEPDDEPAIVETPGELRAKLATLEAIGAPDAILSEYRRRLTPDRA